MPIFSKQTETRQPRAFSRATIGALTALTFLVSTSGSTAGASDIVTGACVKMQRPMQSQDALLWQLKSNGVHAIRAAFTDPSTLDADVQFAKKCFVRDIAILLVLLPQCPPDPTNKEVVPRKKLSAAGPEASRAYFNKVFSKLEAQGVVLEGIELGNEINFAGANGDFPALGAGKGVTFDLDALTTDPEARQIAKGFMRYLKVLEALKDARDHSMLNRNTPIISAGLADFDANWPTASMKMDAVGLDATLRFLRKNGLDHFVDGYGIHRSPQDKTPEERKARLERALLAGRSRIKDGKPVWITEWSVNNFDHKLPPDESQRLPIIKETMENMRAFGQQGRIIGAFYYRWDSVPAVSFDPTTIFRGNALTDAGKQIFKP